MSIYCPYTNGNVVYLKCQECEDKICEKGWFFCGVGGTPMSMLLQNPAKRWLLWRLCTPVNEATFSCLLETMICPHTYRSSSKKAV